MKRMCVVLVALFALSGCGRFSQNVDRAMDFRTRMLQADGCEFTAVITADYEQILHTFKMKCRTDSAGAVTFEVLSPESIAGITGYLGADTGKLTFDDHALLFSLQADGRYSPVSAPWIVMRAIRAGYIQGCEEDSGETVIYLNDTYYEDALELIVRLNAENELISAEIFSSGSRILSVGVENFEIM